MLLLLLLLDQFHLSVILSVVLCESCLSRQIVEQTSDLFKLLNKLIVEQKVCMCVLEKDIPFAKSSPTLVGAGGVRGCGVPPTY